MSNISSLFCTPEQGRRLKELVPKLKHTILWEFFVSVPTPQLIINAARRQSETAAPALTLQELRVFISHHKELRRRYDNTMNRYSLSTTAPELAAWVIERLEDTP